MSFLKLSMEHAQQLMAILGKMPHEHGQLLDIGLNILRNLEQVAEVIDAPKNDTPA